MDNLSLLLQGIIQKYMGLVENKLRITKQRAYPQAVIRSGSWINERIIIAYTSFFPNGDNSEESIDFMFQLTVSEATIEFQADISRSNGELLFDVTSNVFTFTTAEELLARVENQSIKASEILSSRLNKIDSWLK